jgi:hypothetical protein
MGAPLADEAVLGLTGVRAMAVLRGWDGSQFRHFRNDLPTFC